MGIETQTLFHSPKNMSPEQPPPHTHTHTHTHTHIHTHHHHYHHHHHHQPPPPPPCSPPPFSCLRPRYPQFLFNSRHLQTCRFPASTCKYQYSSFLSSFHPSIDKNLIRSQHFLYCLFAPLVSDAHYQCISSGEQKQSLNTPPLLPPQFILS